MKEDLSAAIVNPIAATTTSKQRMWRAIGL
jgi:hypothetical protein